MTQQPKRERVVLNALFGLTERINEGATLEELLKDVARIGYKICGASTCSVMLLDEEKESLLCRVGVGLPPSEMKKIKFKVGEGVAGWVVRNNEPLRLVDGPEDPRFQLVEGQLTAIRAICCAPLSTEEGAIGAITITSPEPGSFTGEDQAVLLFLAGAISNDVENARLYRLAVTDRITGVFNRQYLVKRLPAEVDRYRRYNNALTIIVFRPDKTNEVADARELAGTNHIAHWLAQLAMELIREVDSLVRYNELQFVLILPSSNRKGAQKVAERLRDKIANTDIVVGERTFQITASLGVAQLHGADLDADGLLAVAADALDVAQAQGGNQISFHPEPEED